jgi:hypothetical protein
VFRVEEQAHVAMDPSAINVFKFKKFTDKLIDSRNENLFRPTTVDNK